ncbi:MAG TPA: DUF6152 family protein [Micropepsaceae bacterium]|nr:DUF6152 family protein [Micropepsaceae bacterium]
MKCRALIFGAIAAGLSITSAAAHHSFAMFDAEKMMTRMGVVKEFEWTNPHVWIHIVADEAGKPVDWSFEMQAIAQDAKLGWRADSVKPGDKVTIEFHPLKDGSRGGQLVAATLADGTRLGGPVRAPGTQD